MTPSPSTLPPIGVTCFIRMEHGVFLMSQLVCSFQINGRAQISPVITGVQFSNECVPRASRPGTVAPGYGGWGRKGGEVVGRGRRAQTLCLTN